MTIIPVQYFIIVAAMIHEHEVLNLSSLVIEYSMLPESPASLEIYKSHSFIHSSTLFIALMSDWTDCCVIG